jgi:hypothetical protein
VYSHLIPREDHIALLYQPTRDHKPPRLRLDIMRTNRQIYKEVTKYFYENRTLFMTVSREKSSQMPSDQYVSRYYETLAVMNAETRRLFTKLEMCIAQSSEQIFAPRRYQKVPDVTDVMQHIFSLLPNLKFVTIVLGATPVFPLKAVVRIAMQRNDTLDWLLQYIPPEVEIIWEQKRIPALEGPWSEFHLWNLIKSRGSLVYGKSITCQLAAKRLKTMT